MKGYISIKSIQPSNTKAFELLDSINAVLSRRSPLASSIGKLLEQHTQDEEGVAMHLAAPDSSNETLSVYFSEKPYGDIYRQDDCASLLMTLKVDHNDTIRNDAGEHIAGYVMGVLEKINPSKIMDSISFDTFHSGAEVFCYTDSVDMRIGGLINLQKALDRDVIFSRNGDLVVIDDLSKLTIKTIDSKGEILAHSVLYANDIDILDDEMKSKVSEYALEQGARMARDAISLWRVSQIVNSWCTTFDGDHDNDHIDIDNIIHGEASIERISEAYSDLDAICHDGCMGDACLENIADTLDAITSTLSDIASTKGLIYTDDASRFIHEIEVFFNTKPFVSRIRREIEARESNEMH